MALRRAVVSSSRGSQTKLNSWPFKMLRTCSSPGRGRSASDMAIITSAFTAS